MSDKKLPKRVIKEYEINEGTSKKDTTIVDELEKRLKRKKKSNG